MTSQTHDELLARFAAGDRQALARLLTLVELGDAPELPPVDEAKPCTRVIGIAGSGGAGKSTLVGAFVKFLREQNLRVAILASDPQSPRTGGALLGDRVRVTMDPNDDGVYFRSLSTRGAPGGLAEAVAGDIPCLKRFGFDVILVETVGIGQDQTAVRDVVQTLVLVVTPGTGDEIQWEKAGLIELADILVVNKSDMPSADRVQHQLRRALSLSPEAENIPILATIATSGEGVAELWNAMVAHGDALPDVAVP
ncbi:MAG: hypothetical protein MPJ50_02040 [Pirellulales bacterium]|nr:hypothetical protein [Pirellulales bacterium]